MLTALFPNEPIANWYWTTLLAQHVGPSLLSGATIKVMRKQKKKRNKQYTGRDAVQGPTVHHYSAKVKSPTREWWDDHKRTVKYTAYIGGGGVIAISLLAELFHVIFG